MRILLVLALIKILELSRFNITKFGLSRSFYDLLSLLLLAAFIVYLFSARYTEAWENKVETAFHRISLKWAWLLDIILIVMLGWLIYHVTGHLYSNPIRCRTADMLPMIRDAAEYLVQGKDPFTHFYCPWQLPYIYLPMMLITYLPAVFVKIDIRFISLAAFALLIPFTYRFYRSKGFYLTGFLLAVILLTSGLFPLLLLSVHTFPYLLILAVLFYALLKDKDGLMFFSLAAALLIRKFFWLFLPVFVIYFLKQHKLTWRNIKYFSAGALLGSIPYVLFPNPFFQIYLDFFKESSLQFNKASIVIKNSLGFSYYLQDHRTLSKLILIILVGTIFILAVKYLKKSNVWLFLALISFVMLYFQVQTRSQEYYFLQLLVIFLFIPIKEITRPVLGRRRILSFCLIPPLIMAAALFFPAFSGKDIVIKPIWGHLTKSPPGELWSKGFIELSIGANFAFQKETDIAIQIRRLDHQDNKPVRVKLDINAKNFLNQVYQKRKIDILLPRAALKKYCYVGANQIEIQLTDPEDFAIKISPVRGNK